MLRRLGHYTSVPHVLHGDLVLGDSDCQSGIAKCYIIFMKFLSFKNERPPCNMSMHVCPCI